MTGILIDDGEEARGSPRAVFTVHATLRDRKSNRFQVRMLDLSVTGFRAEAHYGLDPGAIVWLTIPGMEGLEATVAWRTREVVGCQFVQPLHPAIFDHLRKTLCA